MKFVLATWGSRGDVEPNLAVGRELVRRGHDVCMAVPPDLVGFTEAAGVDGGRLRAESAGPFWIRTATSGRVSSATPGGSGS